jgi:hypothetical protein
MTWFHWLLVVLFAVKAVARIGMIGEPRQPITKGDAFVGVVVNVLLMCGVFVYAR